jgi:hypothetical protein
MPKVLGMSVSKGNKKWAVLGLGGIGVIAVMWAMTNLVSPGRKHGPLPPLIPPIAHWSGGGGPPPMHAGPPPHPMAVKAHLANIVPPRGPPNRSTLGVGGRIAGIGSGGGMYRWPSGRAGRPGGYGVAGGYLAYT